MMTDFQIGLGDEAFTLDDEQYWFRFPENGGAQSLRSSSPFSPKMTAGGRTYGDYYDPVSAVAFTDLSGGMGQENADDLTKFFTGNNVDTRSGHLVLGPAPTTTVMAATGAPDYASSLHPWFAVDATRPRLYVRWRAPADCALCDRVWLPLLGTVEAQPVTVTVLDADFMILASTTIERSALTANGSWLVARFTSPATLTPGADYFFRVSHSGPVNSLKWLASVGEPYTGESGWSFGWDPATEELIDLKVRLLFWTDDPNVRPAAPARFALGAGRDGVQRLWLWAGRRIYYVGSAGTPVVAAESSAGAPHTCAADVCGACWYQATGATTPELYLALDGETTAVEKFDAEIGDETWTTITAKAARVLAVHDGTLWRAYDRNAIQGTLDGTWADGAGTPVAEPVVCRVGDRSTPIRNMVSWKGNLWVGKDDGLYEVTLPTGYPISTDAPTANLAVDLRSQAAGNNFEVMVVHRGDLYFSVEQGLMRLSSGLVLSNVTPESGMELAVGERSTYRAAWSTLGQLWVVAEGALGRQSNLLALVEGNWHPLYASSQIGALMRGVCVEPGLYGPTARIWLSEDGAITYLKVPQGTQRRYLWEGMNWAESGSLTLSWLDGGIRTINKDWMFVELDCRNVAPDPGPAVEVWWRPNETTAWASLGTITTPGIQRLPFPAGSYSSKCQVLVELNRGLMQAWAEPVSPFVEAIVVRYMERPPDLRQFSRTYRLGTLMSWRSGAQRVLNIAQQMAFVQTMRESAEPLGFTTFWGGEYAVQLVDYAVMEEPVRSNDLRQEAVMLLTMRLQVVA